MMIKKSETLSLIITLSLWIIFTLCSIFVPIPQKEEKEKYISVKLSLSPMEKVETTEKTEVVAKSEPVKTEPVKTESAEKTEPVAKTESVKTEPVKTEPVKTENAKVSSPKQEPTFTPPKVYRRANCRTKCKEIYKNCGRC